MTVTEAKAQRASSNPANSVEGGARVYSRKVKALNTSVTSENKIHDDTVAAKYGFTGALVAGVNVYAYMTYQIVKEWGVEWLSRGGMTVSFARPVYDGDELTLTSTVAPSNEKIEVTVHGPNGDLRASGTARRIAEAPGAAIPQHKALPKMRPAGSPSSLSVGTLLGALTITYTSSHAPEYLGWVRDDLSIYKEGPFVHPGWLLRWPNYVLCDNVELGPWIHVSSEVTKLGTVRPDQPVEARGLVLEEFEKNGHRFVVLDVVLLVDDEPVERVKHTAIYQPRPRN